jgi:hypothetical protein
MNNINNLFYSFSHQPTVQIRHKHIGIDKCMVIYINPPKHDKVRMTFLRVRRIPSILFHLSNIVDVKKKTMFDCISVKYIDLFVMLYIRNEFQVDAIDNHSILIKKKVKTNEIFCPIYDNKQINLFIAIIQKV